MINVNIYTIPIKSPFVNKKRGNGILLYINDS